MSRKYKSEKQSNLGPAKRNLALAAKALERTLGQYERTQKWQHAARICTQLGKLNAQMKQWDRSFWYYRKSMDYYTKHQDVLQESVHVRGLNVEIRG